MAKRDRRPGYTTLALQLQMQIAEDNELSASSWRGLGSISTAGCERGTLMSMWELCDDAFCERTCDG